MYVGTMAQLHPDREAIVMDDGDEVISYRELDEASNQLAHALRAEGIGPGDVIAVMLENRPHFGYVWWAAMRSGLYVTPVNWHLTAGEVEYILANSQSRVLFFSPSTAEVAHAAAARLPELVTVQVGGGQGPVSRSYGELVDGRPVTPIDGETAGAPMFYSSGTTGRPKGIKAPLSGLHPSESPTVANSIAATFGIGAGDRYLSTGPLYHSAPPSWSFGCQTTGATAVVMSRFDARQALDLLRTQDITHSQWVPTMFQRLLRLPDDVRATYEAPRHRAAYHAAAPCPPEVKRRMIEWWGPIIEEYYAASEGGATTIGSEDWLAHPGSVGRHWTGGKIHILDLDTKEELPPGRQGGIYFEPFAANQFRYHDDPEKTASVYHDGLVTAGDVGYLDDDGYLYLTDRVSNMIISGGVNIYPQEIENHLASHPAVLDVAVFGVPNDEFGEEVKAVVQVAPGHEEGDALAAELMAFCRQELARYKCPRSVEFVAEMPRDPNGKLYKRRLRDAYWEGRTSRLV